MSESNEKMSLMDRITGSVEKIAGPMAAFGQIPFVKALVNGMVAALPVTMVGSIFLVIYLFCSDGGLTEKALLSFMTPYADSLALVNSLSMGIMAIYIVVAFGAEYAYEKGINKTTGAVGTLFAFILLNYNQMTPLARALEDGTAELTGESGIATTYWGGAGLITAMIAGIGRAHV